MVKLSKKQSKKRPKVRIRGNQWLSGKRGAAAQYIPRARAIRKLQMSISEFRKLCILKGIYPRKPKRQLMGKNKTYYLKKDISFIQSDPVVRKLLERRAWRKKINRAVNKGLKLEAESLKQHLPTYTLTHIVKDRYPTFDHALQDIDDCLTMVFLFSMMPTTDLIPAVRISNCRKLSIEFLYYVMKTHSLRKVFVSIKGIYYQAEIRTHIITWIVPHAYNIQEERNVDYSIMLNFLEFYETFLGFINFKLYQNIGISYPPNYQFIKVRKGNLLESLITRPVGQSSPEKQQNPKNNKKNQKIDQITANQIALSNERISSLNETLKQVENEDDDDAGTLPTEEPTPAETQVLEVTAEEQEDIFRDDSTSLIQKDQQAYEGLFSSCHFWLSREVPRESLEFVIKSFGGAVSWDGNGKETKSSITHCIVDRPKIEMNIITRDYVQPQWVYDSVNNRILLPPSDYSPGAKLPPHLSPFVDDYSTGYVPDYRKKLDSYYQEKTGIIRSQEPTEIEESESQEEEEEDQYAEDLNREISGKTNHPPDWKAQERKNRTKSITKKRQKVEEAKQQKITEQVHLSYRKRKLLRKLRSSKKARSTRILKLEERRNMIKSGNAHIDGNTLVYDSKPIRS